MPLAGTPFQMTLTLSREVAAVDPVVVRQVGAHQPAAIGPMAGRAELGIESAGLVQ